MELFVIAEIPNGKSKGNTALLQVTLRLFYGHYPPAPHSQHIGTFQYRKRPNPIQTMDLDAFRDGQENCRNAMIFLIRA